MLEVTEGVSISVNNGGITFEPLSVGSYLELEAKTEISEARSSAAMTISPSPVRSKKETGNLPEEKAGGEKSLTAAVNNGDIDIEISKVIKHKGRGGYPSLCV